MHDGNFWVHFIILKPTYYIILLWLREGYRLDYLIHLGSGQKGQSAVIKKSFALFGVRGFRQIKITMSLVRATSASADQLRQPSTCQIVVYMTGPIASLYLVYSTLREHHTTMPNQSLWIFSLAQPTLRNSILRFEIKKLKNLLQSAAPNLLHLHFWFKSIQVFSLKVCFEKFIVCALWSQHLTRTSKTTFY